MGRNHWLWSATAAGLCCLGAQASAAAAADVAADLARHGIEEAPVPARQKRGWHAPRKILMLQYGGRVAEVADLRRATESLRTAAAGKLVVVNDATAAVREAADADVIIGLNPDVCDARILAAARELRWLASMDAGIELCMATPEVRNGAAFTMTNMRGADAPAIAEHALALLLALAHNLDRFAVDTAQARWNKPGAAGMQTLQGKTLLVAGLGRIGTEVARRAQALGMRVVATRAGAGEIPSFVAHVGQPEELLSLAAEADVIINCLPLTAATTRLYDRQFFARLQRTAYFINVARAGSVVTEELVAALTEGRLAGAGLDVVEPEPLPPQSPLWKAPRLLITPHIAPTSDLPKDIRWTVAVENLRRYAAGDRLLNEVDLTRGY